MAKVRKPPETLRPYLFHGVNLRWQNGINQTEGVCPFCDREGNKFSVLISTSQYNCHACGEQGNSLAFIRRLWKLSDKATTSYRELAENRGLLPETLMHWGVARSIVDGSWLIPAFNANGSQTQLYKWVKKDDRWLAIQSPTFGPKLFGRNLFNKRADTIYFCEGPWDAMALWEILRQTRWNQRTKTYEPTANPDRSLLATSNVLGVPGTNVFDSSWATLTKRKTVILCYDSDHPKQHAATGAVVKPAGYEGVRLAAATLLAATMPPESIRYLKWGEEGYDKTLPSGYDVRDLLSAGPPEGSTSLLEPLELRVVRCGELLGKVCPIDAEDAGEQARAVKQRSKGGGSDATTLEPIPCDRYRTLTMAWRRALKWTPGLDHALAAMLASIASVKGVGDQLWLKVLGPPSCGKSVLCEALSVNKRYVLAKSTIRGFHSGYRSEGADKHEDNSLVAALNNMTLVTKDGDTLLQSPNLPQILAEGRDIYDCVSRTHYRNQMSKDYEGIRMTWLLCGTDSLRSIDNSELGERFLDVRIMREIDEELEREIQFRVVNQTVRNVALEADGTPESQRPPELTEAMAVTAGYIDYLRENVFDLLGALDVSEASKETIMDYAKFVACVRARPSSYQEESASREFSPRLTAQLMRLATCLAVVMNRTSLDDVVMERVRRVVLDTSDGQTLSIIRLLAKARREGSQQTAVSISLGMPEAHVKRLLNFMRDIKVVESFQHVKAVGTPGRPRWRLTEGTARLWRVVNG